MNIYHLCFIIAGLLFVSMPFIPFIFAEYEYYDETEEYCYETTDKKCA